MKNRNNYYQMQPKTMQQLSARKKETTILVVDDDALIRKMVTLMLAKQEYYVITAASARQAYAISLLRKDAIHLVLTDITMPEIDGFELVSMLRSLRQDFEVLYMSGFFNGFRCKIRDEDFIYKPFTAPELYKKIEAKLGVAHSAASEVCEVFTEQIIFNAI